MWRVCVQQRSERRRIGLGPRFGLCVRTASRYVYAATASPLHGGAVNSANAAMMRGWQAVVARRPGSTQRLFATQQRRPTMLGDQSSAIHSFAAASSVDTRGKQGRVFRRGFISSEMSGGTALSVDLPLRKFLDLFCDFDSKRCLLCGETFTQWHQHQNTIPHSGREALLLELVRAQCGRPEEIVALWTRRLLSEPMFQRIDALSHGDGEVRRRRLLYLLRVLKDRRVLVHTFDVMERGSGISARRSWDFERLEWEGDNVIKYAFCNVLNCTFPVSEGGVRGQLTLMQFVMDGNDGLARAYDYLELCRLTSNDRIVSKFKSDVVECLFGELQFYLLASEVQCGTYRMPVPLEPQMHTLRALVRHVMSELAIVIFLFHVSHVLSALQCVVEEHQVHFVHTDAVTTTRLAKGDAEADVPSAGQKASTTSNAAAVPTSGYHLSAIRLPRSAPGPSAGTSVTILNVGPGTAVMETSVAPGLRGVNSYNEDAFRRVVPIGGLHTSPSSAEPDATYMPELQVAPQLSSRLPQMWASHAKHALCEVGAGTSEMACVEGGGLAPRPRPRIADLSMSSPPLTQDVYLEHYSAYDLVPRGVTRVVTRGT